MNYFDDEQSWHEAQNEYMERYAPPATMSDAHAEWHLNSGVPMGQPGCPQDACHPVDEEWCCETFVEGTLGLHDHDCPENDGAPTHQWEVTEPPCVDDYGYHGAPLDERDYPF